MGRVIGDMTSGRTLLLGRDSERNGEEEKLPDEIDEDEVDTAEGEQPEVVTCSTEATSACLLDSSPKVHIPHCHRRT